MITYIKFEKNETSVHPQTGESKPYTIFDVYIKEDEVCVWGWGYVNTYKPTKKHNINDIVNFVRKNFLERGFKILNEM